MSSARNQILQAAMELGAIKINLSNPYRWASGYYMPIYNDNRLLLARADVRRLITDCFIEILTMHKLSFEIIAGTATAGIPGATSLADRLELPLSYVRSSSKDHGLKKLIEGAIIVKACVVLIEDVISTGGSALAAVNAIKSEQMHVAAVCSVFSYGFSEALDKFKQAQISLFSIIDYQTLTNFLSNTGKYSAADLEQLEAWRAAPFAWGINKGFNNN